MKILSAEQMRGWDIYTMQHEPISSLALMERAANACVQWMRQAGFHQSPVVIFCGKGNNGGDGLAIARMLATLGTKVTVYILEFGSKGTDDFQANLARLHQVLTDIHFIQSPAHLHPIAPGSIIIDALFGSGLNRAPEGLSADIIQHINEANCVTLAVDMPSGMPADNSSAGNDIVKATYSLTFQALKPAFLLPENAAFTGQVILLDIGLHPQYLASLSTNYELIERYHARQCYRPRNRFMHKGHFGHALLIAGSYDPIGLSAAREIREGKMGAAILAARACLRSGVGLLTCAIPVEGYTILQTAVPEAMVLTGALEIGQAGKYAAIGVGPGCGMNNATRIILTYLFAHYPYPIVLDADALNIIALNPELLPRIPPGSILTPHPKEFERLFGATPNDYARLARATEKAALYQCFIVLKGHHSFIACPDGKGWFNSTGNAGMATGGSGDVLTGILTGLLAQGYTPLQTCLLGVYLHGRAGDIAAEKYSMESMIAGDITNCLGEAFKEMAKD
jgi:NAD(P)H-hydrate epimerase